MNTKRDTTSATCSMPTRFRRRIRWAPLAFLAALALALAVTAHGETAPATIPFSEIGARATAGYQGDALGVTATADGALLRCGFQKLEGHATREGLWLESTKPGAVGRFRLTATALGRAGLSTLNSQPSTVLAAAGTVSVQDKLVRYTRPGLTEEYSVSADGVRQDIAITAPPVGAGDLRVELGLSGARAEAAACGARLRLDGSGRVLAYSRLRVEDATGRELTARLEVLSADRLAVNVADANATYPVRIDPTFSDADWVGLQSSLPGTDNSVRAFAVDDGGNLYVGGTFSLIGTVVANRIAKWDGSAWSALGGGLGGNPNDGPYVGALAVSGTNLYAAGRFTMIGGVPAASIAKWDGNAWSALGSGIPHNDFYYYNAYVTVLAVSGTTLYVGGWFTNAGGVAATNIAKWNGSAWSSLGTGVDYSVGALAVAGNALYVGGGFTNAGGVLAKYLAKWDGSSWSAVAPALRGYSGATYVNALAVSGTDLYVGGTFTNAGPVAATNIAKWNGSTWAALGSGITPNSYINALALSGTTLYAGGYFNVAGGVTAYCIAKWDGSAWSPLDLGVWPLSQANVNSLAVVGTNLYVGGYFTAAGNLNQSGGVPANNIAKWDGNAWSAICPGMGYILGPPALNALAVSGTNLYAGGVLSAAGGVPVSAVAKWDGSAWSALGSGLGGGDINAPLVNALSLSGTNLYVGGSFTTAGGAPATNVAKWDGSAWSGLGSGMGGGGMSYPWVYALAASGGDLYVGGYFTKAGGVAANYIAKWDGSSWSPLGGGMGGTDPGVRALAMIGTDLYVGGTFTTAGTVAATNIAKWNGSAWSALGSGLSATVNALAVSGTTLYAGGVFMNAGGYAYVAEWDGSAWSALGSGMGPNWPLFGPYVNVLAISGTDLFAGGQFWTAGGVWATNIAKWDGSAWSPLGSGMNNTVRALATDGAGRLFVGGSFTLAGTNVSSYIAQAILLPSAPTILWPPTTQTAEAGATVYLAVDAVGDPLPACLWYLNGTNIPSCTSSDLVLTNILFSQSGTYTVVVTNLFGAVTSGPVTLNVIAAVERRPVPGVKATGETGSLVNVDYVGFLSRAPNWTMLGSVSLTSTSQYYFDLTLPLPPQRYYRAWQAGAPGTKPSLDVHIVPAITVTGSIGGSVRVDAINQFGPIDAWFTLDTVTLTNTSQLYFDTSVVGQPERLYRLVQVP